jgi:hypothetical protein
MAKGFGSPQKGHLGYVLLLLPEMKTYASTDPFGDDEDFIGITNSLEDARIWKKKKDAEAALQEYGGFFADYLEEEGKTGATVRVCSLERLSNGKLKTDPEVEITFEKVSKP